MTEEMKTAEKMIRSYQEKYSELDAMTVEQLANDEALNSASAFRDYVNYNILMIKNSGSTLISQLRKLRFENFIRTHVGLFYSGERAEKCASNQIEWFNKQLAV